MEQWREELYSTELYHYGIKGMRWGVRRYQNYDGTYTQAGLKRYNQVKGTLDKASDHKTKSKAALKKAESDYRSAVNKWEAKKAGDKKRKNLIYTGDDPDYKKVKDAESALEKAKKDYSDSKGYLKEAKRLEKSEYKQLKNDYKADKGKELYKQGKTIEDINLNRRLQFVANMGIHAATETAANGFNVLHRTGIAQIKLDRNVANAIHIGAEVVDTALGIKAHAERQQLRAYYAHSTDNKNVKAAEELSKKFGGSSKSLSKSSSKVDAAQKKMDDAKKNYKKAVNDYESRSIFKEGLINHYKNNASEYKKVTDAKKAYKDASNEYQEARKQNIAAAKSERDTARQNYSKAANAYESRSIFKEGLINHYKNNASEYKKVSAARDAYKEASDNYSEAKKRKKKR